MKYFLISLSFLISITTELIYTLNIKESSKSDWDLYKIIFKRNYSDIENIYRHNIYLETRRRIATHNQKYIFGLESYEMGLHQFADLSDKEIFLKFNSKLKSELGREEYTQKDLNFYAKLPRYVNYDEFRVPVYNQGNCSNSHVYSTISSIEGQYFKKYKKSIELSAQELIYCVNSFGNENCKGVGDQRNNFRYILKNGGIGLKKKYSMKNKTNVCNNTEPKIGIKTFYEIPYGNEWFMKAVVALIGPIAAELRTYAPSFIAYRTGIYHEPYCKPGFLSQSVTVVGYGTTVDNKDYWIIKNSWGDWWGIKGYMLLERNSLYQLNSCGIASRAIYPIIN